MTRGAPAAVKALFVPAALLLDATPVPGQRAGLRAGAGAALRLLTRLDYRIIVLASCALDRRQAQRVRPERIADLLARERVALQDCWECDAAGASCAACPPAPALLLRAARVHGAALPASWLLAFDPHHCAAGQRAGCRTMCVAAAGAWLPQLQDAPGSAARCYAAGDIVDAALAIVRLDETGRQDGRLTWRT